MNLTSIHLAEFIEVLHGVLAPQPVVLGGESRPVSPDQPTGSSLTIAVVSPPRASSAT